MSQELNNEFRSNPFKFAQRRPLMPGGAVSMPTNLGSLSLKAGGGDSLYQVTGGARIVSIDLESEGDKVVIKRKAAGTSVQAPAMAAYWLPFSTDQILRITLRKPRDQSLRGAKAPIVANPPNPAAVPAQDTNDPDVFFTAGVNGCMVVVEGSRTEPTVYHANTSTGPSPMDAALDDHDGAEAQRRINTKAGVMSTRVQNLSAAVPKATQGPASQRKGVIQSDYMLMAHDGRLGEGQEQLWSGVRDNIAQVRGIQYLSDKAIRIEKSQGTVFGVKRNGSWTFYYQKLVCYQLWKDQSYLYGYLGANWQKEPGEFWHVAECRLFWPTGGGHVV